MAQRKMTERRHAAHPGLANAPKIPDNSEPWLPRLPRTLAECMWISDHAASLGARCRERLAVCNPEEARGLFERFLDTDVFKSALENPDAEVRAMALAHLREFEAEGDPYSRDILAAWWAKHPER